MTTLFIKPNFIRKERAFNDLFTEFFNTGHNWSAYDQPTNEINETQNTVEVTVDVPGFEKSEVSIDYKDDILQIQAKKTDHNRREVNRRFMIPGIDLSSSSADLKNGVLYVQLEKLPEAKTQTLKIK